LLTYRQPWLLLLLLLLFRQAVRVQATPSGLQQPCLELLLHLLQGRHCHRRLLRLLLPTVGCRLPTTLLQHALQHRLLLLLLLQPLQL
jgi:hypothetical protein